MKRIFGRSILIFTVRCLLFMVFMGASGQVMAATLFSDNFESYATGSAPGGGWTVSGGTWTVIADGTKVTKQTSTATTYLYNGTSSWTNYAISARVKSGASGYLNGIAGRYKDTNNFYVLALQNGTVVLKKKVSGSWTTLASTSFSFSTSTFYTLKLEMNGTALKGYVDGTQKLTATDSSLSSGKIAFRCEASCSYDDVTVNDFSAATPTPAVTPTPTPASTPTPTTAATPTPAITPTPTPAGRVITCDTTAEIQSALQNAQPGDTILIAPGTYTGSTGGSGNSGAYFYSGVNGTASAPITIKSESAANPATLRGTDNNKAYVFYLTGDYWEVRDLKFSNGKKGIMLDNSNYSLIYNCEVYGIGEEGIHLRDGSSNNVVERCNVHDTGVVTADYGEALYVGSDYGKWSQFIKECDYNTIKDCTLGPNVSAEHVDIKEGTTGTIVQGCALNGTGISGANAADSFMDVKGNQGVIKNNIGYRNGNSIIVDAFQVHQRQSGWGLNNDFSGNTVYLDSATPYVVTTDSNGTARVSGNTRSPSGNMYSGNITEY
jgi:parallel beta-helix repeat protein